jgi:hypothetical protein
MTNEPLMRDKSVAIDEVGLLGLSPIFAKGNHGRQLDAHDAVADQPEFAGFLQRLRLGEQRIDPEGSTLFEILQHRNFVAENRDVPADRVADRRIEPDRNQL